MENAAELESPAAPALTEHELTLLARARRVADAVLEPNAERYDAAGVGRARHLRRVPA